MNDTMGDPFSTTNHRHHRCCQINLEAHSRSMLYLMRMKAGFFISILLLANISAIAQTKTIDSESTSDKNGSLAVTEQLLSAARSGETETVKSLLEKGADINAKNAEGMTALMEAASQGHANVVKLLLDEGADINAENARGWDALMFANIMGMDQTNTSGLNASELLLEKGSGGINAALMFAAGQGHTDAVKLLLDEGADINMKDKYGDTLLVHATEAGHTDVVKLLLDKGAGGINAALMKAAYRADTSTVELLLDKGADINAKVIGAFGDTALMNAVVSGDTNVIELLLARGADINGVDADGETALGMARRMGNAAIVRLLKKAGAIASSASDSSFNAAVASGTNTDSSGYVTNVALLVPFTLTNSAGDVITNAVLVKLMPNKFVYKTPDESEEGTMPLTSLPTDLREKFGYNPQAAMNADAADQLRKESGQRFYQQQMELAEQQARQKAALNTAIQNRHFIFGRVIQKVDAGILLSEGGTEDVDRRTILVKDYANYGSVAADDWINCGLAFPVGQYSYTTVNNSENTIHVFTCSTNSAVEYYLKRQ